MADVEQPPLPGTAETLLGTPIPEEGPDVQPGDPSVVPAPEVVAAQERSELQLTALTAPTIEELLADPLWSEFQEKIWEASEDTVFAVADDFALRYMLERIIPKLPKKQQEAARMVIEYTNFAGTKDQRLGFIGLSHVHQQISRRLILHMIEGDQFRDRGFNKLEALELTHGIAIADAMDEIYMKWEFMDHDLPDSADRERRGLTNKWALVRDTGLLAADENPAHKEVSYKKLFPAEYERIIQSLDELLASLEGLENPAGISTPLHLSRRAATVSAKIQYYQSLRDAFALDDLEAMQAAWLKADELYIDQVGPDGSNRLVTIHPIETGYGANATGIIPQYSLRFRLGAESPLIQKIEAARIEMQKRLPDLLAECPKACEQLQAITKCPILYYFAVNSGIDLVFAAAGQTLPNEREIIDRRGTLTTVSPHTMAKRISESGQLFRGLFSTDQHDLLKTIISDDLIVGVSEHEMGHSILTHHVFASDMEGKRDAIEEWKASGTEWALIHANRDQLTDEQLIGAFVSDICQAMRYIQRRKDPSQRPYYGSYQFFMKLAQEAGVLTKEESGWRLNINREKLLGFFESVTKKWVELIGIYETGDQEKFTQFVDDAIQETPFIRDVIACIERE